MSIVSIGIPFSAAEVDRADSAANASASVGASGVSGDSSLFTLVDAQTPYVRAEKSSYDVDTPVLLTADTFGKYPDAVLKLYEGKDVVPTTSSKPVYTFALAGHEGQTIDIKNGTYHSDNTNGRPASLGYDLNYTAVLHPDASSVEVLASAYVDVNNATRLTSGTDTLLEVSRKIYQYGEPIIVKAKSSKTGAWLGVYDKGADHKAVAPYFIHLEGPNQSNNGSNRYLNNISYKNTDSGDFTVINQAMELEVGEYDVKLFDAANPMTANVLLQTTFKIQYSAAYTNKSTYGYGEDIFNTVEHYVTSDYSIDNTLVLTGADVGHRQTVGGTPIQRIPLNKNVTLVSESGPTTSNWAYIQYNGKNGYTAGAYLDPVAGTDAFIFGTAKRTDTLLYKSRSKSTSNVYASFPVGTPFNYIEYYSPTWFKARVGGYEGWVYRNGETSTTYVTQTFRPHVNSDKPAVTTADARAALYPSSVTPASGVTNNGYYYTSASQETSMVLQDCNGGSQATPAGTYKLHLFGTSGYTSLASKSITVSGDVTANFTKGAYEVDNLSDGFANGRVAFELDYMNDYGYLGNDDTYAVVYWAKADGTPLEGYSSFFRTPLDKNVISFDMQPYSIIPEGAAGLVAYVEFNGVKGEGKYIALPSGCKTYTGLDNASFTEFQILADTKLGDSTEQYPNNNEDYRNALVDIAKNGSNSQFVLINGDVTRGGTIAQWELTESLRAEAATEAGKTVPQLYVARGNTDDA
ncbi:MAG: hypothetical protein II225_05000, partial [Ruminococcus sp.]|nr:hypothetical protein [Ruminococcus sp.]